MQKEKGFSLLTIILIIVGVVIIAGGGTLIYQHYKSTPINSKSVACTPNWQCSWGPCVNGSQSQIATDSNNCGTTAGSNIACPALAKVCVSSAQPSITITSPTANQTITNPILIKGQSNTFEGYVSIRIKDSNGKVLANDQAHGGSGQLGAFSKSVTYSAPSAKNGTIEVFENSAKDGSEINKVTVPVIFGDFKSTQPSITVTSPNGGETWTANETPFINWTYSGIGDDYSKVLVYIVNYDNNKVCLIVNGVPIWGKGVVLASMSGDLTDYYSCTSAGNKMKIRLVLKDNPSVSDESNNYFSIAPR
jgi:hypothetical protein